MSTRRTFLKTSAAIGGALTSRSALGAVGRRAASRAAERQARRRPRAGVAQHSHPRRHGIHRAGAGRVRDRARTSRHAVQSQQDAPRHVQGQSRRGADRRPEQRHERAQGQEVRRRARQSDDAPGLGAERGEVSRRQRQALHLHLDDVDVLATRARSGINENSPTTPMPAGLDPYTLDPTGRVATQLRRAQDARRAGSANAVSGHQHGHSSVSDRRSARSHRSIHVLAGAHRQGRGSARARQAGRSVSVHRLARSRRVDGAHGRGARVRDCTTRSDRRIR